MHMQQHGSIIADNLTSENEGAIKICVAACSRCFSVIELVGVSYPVFLLFIFA